MIYPKKLQIFVAEGWRSLKILVPYSLLKLFTGLANAALIAWKLIVSTGIALFRPDTIDRIGHRGSDRPETDREHRDYDRGQARNNKC